MRECLEVKAQEGCQRVLQGKGPGMGGGQPSGGPGWASRVLGGRGETGDLWGAGDLAAFPPPPTPPIQPGFGPSRRLCENVPGAGRQPCSSWSRTRTSSLSAPRSEGQLCGAPEGFSRLRRRALPHPQPSTGCSCSGPGGVLVAPAPARAPLSRRRSSSSG